MAIYSEFSHKKMWFRIVMLVYQRVLFSYLWKSLEVQISGWMLGMLWFKHCPFRGTDIFHIIKYEWICLGCPLLGLGSKHSKPETSHNQPLGYSHGLQTVNAHGSNEANLLQGRQLPQSGHRWTSPEGIPALQTTGPQWAPHIVTISIGWAWQFQAILKTSKN